MEYTKLGKTDIEKRYKRWRELQGSNQSTKYSGFYFENEYRLKRSR